MLSCERDLVAARPQQLHEPVPIPDVSSRRFFGVSIARMLPRLMIATRPHSVSTSARLCDVKKNRHRWILSCERSNHLSHSFRRQWIERTCWFIEQKHWRTRQHRARHGKSLLVSCRQLAKTTSRDFVQFELRKQILDALFSDAI